MPFTAKQIQKYQVLIKLTLLSILSFAMSSATSANQLSDQKQPAASIEATQNKLQLVGESDFSVWFWDVYHIKLFTENGQYVKNKWPLMLALQYQRDITSKDLIDETENQWQRFELEPAKIQLWLKQLSAIWPNVNEGDKITFYIDQNADTAFYFNDAFIGEINDPAFAAAFSQIWLAPNGPYPKMTAKLTGSDS